MENMFAAKAYKVLVVDDNLINREVAKDFLSTYHFQLWEAESGFQAIDLVKGTKFDLIFMDLMMPDMDGIQAVEKIRRECGGNGKSPVIVGLTANETEGLKEKFLTSGFQDFLTKPLHREQLNQVLSQWGFWEFGEGVQEDVLQGEADPGFSELHIPGIDRDLAQEYHGDSLEDYRELLKLYVLDGKRKKELLEQLFADKNFRKYEVEVHGLKSASANIGALELSKLFLEQERAAERGDGELISRKFPELLAAYEKQLDCIQNHLKTLEEERGQGGIPLSRDTLITELKAALEQVFNFRSRECLKKIESLLRCNVLEDVRERLTEIEEQLKLYEDSRAEQLLQELLDWLVEEEL